MTPEKSKAGTGIFAMYKGGGINPKPTKTVCKIFFLKPRWYNIKCNAIVEIFTNTLDAYWKTALHTSKIVK